MIMPKNFSKLLTGTLLLASACTPAQKKETGKNELPNILLIVADDLGYGDLHCYGNKITDTPHLDKLAEEGVLFTNAYASCTVCSPTRASLLTGMNPVALNLTDFIPGRQANGPQPGHKLISPKFNWQLPLETITIAEKLKEKNYATASIGKWHLGDTGFLPTKHGFDINIAGNDYGMPPSYYYPYTSEKKWRTHEITNLEPGNDSLYLTRRLTKEAIQFIQKQKDKPFFLYLPYYTVHTPLEGPPDLVEKYIKRAESLPDTTTYYPHFLAMVESLDRNAGKIMHTLRKLEIEENTLVIFVSDNGGWYTEEKNERKIDLEHDMIGASNNSPLRDGKGTLYDGGLRVPTIIKWPGKIKPGRTSEELIISTDIFSTIMDVLDIEIDYQVEGVSLLPLLMHDKKIDRETLYWHYPHYHKTNPGSAIRDGDYKLIKYYEDNSIELYNLEIDANESNNLAGEMPEKVNELLTKLNSWIEKEGANLPIPNPEYKN